jgi:hypothetical protein
VKNGVWLVVAKLSLSCWICHTQDCHFLGPLQQTASQRYLSTCKQHCGFTVLLSLQHFCSMDSKTFVTFYRCAIIFQVNESLTTLCMAYGLSKSSCNHKFWFPRNCFYVKVDTCMFHSLGHHKYDMCHKHYSLLVMTAVRSSWQRTCRNTYQHAQSPVAVWYQGTTEMNSVWTFLSGHVL